MMVVEVKVCPTAPEKYNHSRKLPSPDLSAIIQTALSDYNKPKHTLGCVKTRKAYSQASGNLSCIFILKKLFIGRQNNNIHKLVTYRCCMLIHRQVQFHNYSRSRTN